MDNRLAHRKSAEEESSVAVNPMKYCSKCSQTYSDDSLNFCLADGTALIVPFREPANNGTAEVVQYPDSKPEPLTAESVRSLLSAWERAQDGKSFATYQACYDPSFVGVKATKSGHSQTYSYRSWMADRRKMIANAVNLNVDISNLQIRVEGDTAIAQFDQYYRSLKYSDWGPKEIRLKMTPSGAKIVREELMASYPL